MFPSFGPCIGSSGKIKPPPDTKNHVRQEVDMLSAVLKFIASWYSQDGRGRAFEIGNGIVAFIERKKQYRILLDGEVSHETISGDEFITLIGDAPQEIEVAISRVFTAQSGMKYAEIVALARPVGKVQRVSATEMWQALGVGNVETAPARAARKGKAPSAEIPL